MTRVKRPTVSYEMVAPILAEMQPKEGDTIAVWFSCGAASAVALKRLAETRPSGYGLRLVRYKGKRIFLDELPPDAKGRPMKTMQTECGIFCPTFKD